MTLANTTKKTNSEQVEAERPEKTAAAGGGDQEPEGGEPEGLDRGLLHKGPPPQAEEEEGEPLGRSSKKGEGDEKDQDSSRRPFMQSGVFRP